MGILGFQERQRKKIGIEEDIGRLVPGSLEEVDTNALGICTSLSEISTDVTS